MNNPFKFKRIPETDPEAIELRRQFHKARPRGKQPLVPPEGIKDKTHLLGLKRKPQTKS